MLAGVGRELRSHYFSHSRFSYIQKCSLELQDQTPGRGERGGWHCWNPGEGSLPLREGLWAGASAGFPLPLLGTWLPSSSHLPAGQVMGHQELPESESAHSPDSPAELQGRHLPSHITQGLADELNGLTKLGRGEPSFLVLFLFCLPGSQASWSSLSDSASIAISSPMWVGLEPAPSSL